MTFAVFWGMQINAFGGFLSHGYGALHEQQHRVESSSQEDAAHSFHHHDESEEQDGSSPSHNPADHSHETSSFAPCDISLKVAESPATYLSYVERTYGARLTRIEKPPQTSPKT